MKTFDEIVVGSGISGMTLALILAANGRSVLLLEKAPIIGGSMARFYKQGIPFDTGFHFTGGFAQDGILTDMLKVLDIEKNIEPMFVERRENNCLVFEDDRRSYCLPLGHAEIVEYLKEVFPEDSKAIDTYFDKVTRVCQNTVSMDLRTITMAAEPCDDDYVSLKIVLDSLTDNESLKALLSAYIMCIGVKPSELSFANYSRVAYSLYQSVARVKDGGDAFIKAFRAKAEGSNIDVRTKTYITKCTDIKDRKVGKFVLNTGEEVTAEHCTFTIHPQGVLNTLPDSALSKAFKDRINEFEPSVGFFSVFATVDSDGDIEDFQPSIISLFPNANVDKMFDADKASDSALVLMKSREVFQGKSYNVLNIFEMSFVEDVEEWLDSSFGKRPDSYEVYKAKRKERIVERILKEFPEYKNKLNILDVASMLTFKDYLNTPYGCAYGIKQKMGQFNLFGKLPLRNLYAAGQSSVLPGVVGAMMSSFIIARSLIGKDKYNDFIEKSMGIK